MAAAALGLAVGNTAQAHLGWTIKQCKAAWGEPGYTGFNSALGMTSTPSSYPSTAYRLVGPESHCRICTSRSTWLME
jgi:hypothetical protein